MRPTRHTCLAIFLAVVCSASAHARDEARPVAIAVTDAIESCVDASTIRFGPADRHALLEPADTDAVRVVIVRRYPMIEEDGLAPERLVLWRHPEFGWVYMSLLSNPAKPGEVCFTAAFGADKVELTPLLLHKYFGVESGR